MTKLDYFMNNKDQEGVQDEKQFQEYKNDMILSATACEGSRP